MLVTALVFFVEHRNDMWKQLRATPRPIGEIYAAKFVGVQVVIGIALVTALTTGILGWMLLPFEMRRMFGAPDAHVYATMAKLVLMMFAALLPVALVQFVLSARMRNILYPIGIGLALTFSNLLLFAPGLEPWLPYAYPGAVVMTRLAKPAAQEVDPAYRAPEDAFALNAAKGKVIVVDEGHANRHSLGTSEHGGTLRWIIEPAERAGMEVRGLYGAARQVEGNLLIVAGAAAAYSAGEIQAIEAWVRGGGSLLLLTDHPPFGNAALAGAFGVKTDPRAPAPSRTVFTELAPHEITGGVRQVVTYGGQTVVRKDSDILLRSQLLAFDYGRGRVVVSGDTALFTAQRKNGASFGVSENETLVLNTFRWLLRLK
ncbi:MAG TPA: ABC transporter permease [Thermoanaerobaculia bacterium]|nr:ABC transporter permease [Thermoanaerobaculia bacterium]